MEYAETVREPGVCSSWVHKFPKTKLLDPPQTLEWSSLDQLPHPLFERFVAKLDQIMKRIPNSLQGHVVEFTAQRNVCKSRRFIRLIFAYVLDSVY
ncbi:MAG: hypothetical protein ACRYFU_17695 [Janthinobacterium lividum]